VVVALSTGLTVYEVTFVMLLEAYKSEHIPDAEVFVVLTNITVKAAVLAAALAASLT
jgi:hypothetical protein